MAESFSDLRKSSREPLVERKRGGDVPKDHTFSSGQAAVSNARHLATKGDISKSELRGVERSVAASSGANRHVTTGKPAEREMRAMEEAAGRQKAKTAKPVRSTKRVV
jgi:hypothetical protein